MEEAAKLAALARVQMEAAAVLLLVLAANVKSPRHYDGGE